MIRPENEDVQGSCLDHYYASILNDLIQLPFCYEEERSTTFNGDNDEVVLDHKTTAEEVCAQAGVPKNELHKIHDGLAKEINHTSISKFNIS